VRHFRLSLSEIWRDVEPRKKRKNKARVSKQNTPKAKKEQAIAGTAASRRTFPPFILCWRRLEKQ
jgi:hypothetical protein